MEPTDSNTPTHKSDPKERTFVWAINVYFLWQGKADLAFSKSFLKLDEHWNENQYKYMFDNKKASASTGLQ